MTKDEIIGAATGTLESIAEDFEAHLPITIQMRLIDDGTGPVVDWLSVQGMREKYTEDLRPPLGRSQSVEPPRFHNHIEDGGRVIASFESREDAELFREAKLRQRAEVPPGAWEKARQMGMTPSVAAARLTFDAVLADYQNWQKQMAERGWVRPPAHEVGHGLPGAEFGDEPQPFFDEQGAIRLPLPPVSGSGPILFGVAESSDEPPANYRRVGWTKDGIWVDGKKVSNASIDEALRLNALALGLDDEPDEPAVVPGKEPS